MRACLSIFPRKPALSCSQHPESFHRCHPSLSQMKASRTDNLRLSCASCSDDIRKCYKSGVGNPQPMGQYYVAPGTMVDPFSSVTFYLKADMAVLTSTGMKARDIRVGNKHDKDCYSSFVHCFQFPPQNLFACKAPLPFQPMCPPAPSVSIALNPALRLKSLLTPAIQQKLQIFNLSLLVQFEVNENK